MKYQADLLSAEKEKALREAESLPFREFEFHGFTGKRRTVSFGWRYDFSGGGLTKTDDMPQFLIGLRARPEDFAKNPPGGFQQVLITEYPRGAGIGWQPQPLLIFLAVRHALRDIDIAGSRSISIPRPSTSQFEGPREASLPSTGVWVGSFVMPEWSGPRMGMLTA
jgi:hypothetical protein